MQINNLENNKNTPQELDAIEFINKISAEFLQIQRERLISGFQNNLSEQGVKWFNRKKEKWSEDKLAFMVFLYNLNEAARERLYDIVKDKKYKKNINLNIGLHDALNVIDKIIDPYEDKIFGSAFDKYFKN